MGQEFNSHNLLDGHLRKTDADHSENHGAFAKFSGESDASVKMQQAQTASDFHGVNHVDGKDGATGPGGPPHKIDNGIRIPVIEASAAEEGTLFVDKEKQILTFKASKDQLITIGAKIEAPKKDQPKEEKKDDKKEDPKADDKKEDPKADDKKEDPKADDKKEDKKPEEKKEDPKVADKDKK